MGWIGDYQYTYYQNKMFIYKNKQINDRNAFNIDIKLFICLFSKILKALLILSLYQKEDNLEFNQRHN